MKPALLLSIMLCSVCYGQASLPKEPPAELRSFEAFTAYLDSMAKVKEKWFYANGYIKAVDSIKLLTGDAWRKRDKSTIQERHYKMADSSWVNSDLTFLIFRYYKKVGKGKTVKYYSRYDL